MTYFKMYASGRVAVSTIAVRLSVQRTGPCSPDFGAAGEVRHVSFVWMSSLHPMLRRLAQ